MHELKKSVEHQAHIKLVSGSRNTEPLGTNGGQARFSRRVLHFTEDTCHVDVVEGQPGDMSRVTDQTGRRPLFALAIAVGVGILIGVAMRKSRTDLSR